MSRDGDGHGGALATSLRARPAGAAEAREQRGWERGREGKRGGGKRKEKGPQVGQATRPNRLKGSESRGDTDIHAGTVGCYQRAVGSAGGFLRWSRPSSMAGVAGSQAQGRGTLSAGGEGMCRCSGLVRGGGRPEISVLFLSLCGPWENHHGAQSPQSGDQNHDANERIMNPH